MRLSLIFNQVKKYVKIRLSGCVDLDGSRDYRQKFIGAFSRIYLSRLGGEGIGLYQMAYPIYLLCLSVSSAGLSCGYFNHGCRKKRSFNDYWRAEGPVYPFVTLVLQDSFFQSPAFFETDGWSTVKLSATREPQWSLLALSPAVFWPTLLGDIEVTSRVFS